jgi:hypothetical protein
LVIDIRDPDFAIFLQLPKKRQWVLEITIKTPLKRSGDDFKNM